MPRWCLVKGCNSNNGKFLVTNNSVTMFAFPKDQVLQSKWLEAISRKDFKVSSSTSICEKHFDPADITRTFRQMSSTTNGAYVEIPLKRKILRVGAIPCRLSDDNWSLDCCVKNCRSNQETRRETFRMFSFPENPLQRKKWLNVMKLNSVIAVLNSKVCERHFKSHEIVTRQCDGKVVLIEGAVPTIRENPFVYLSKALPSPPSPIQRISVDMRVHDANGIPLEDHNSLLNNFKTLTDLMNSDYDSAIGVERINRKDSTIESLQTIRLVLDRVETLDAYFICPVCNVVYGNRATMERHMTFHVEICDENDLRERVDKKHGNTIKFRTIKAFYDCNSDVNTEELVRNNVVFNDCLERDTVAAQNVVDIKIGTSSAGICKIIRTELEKRRLAIERIKKSVAEIKLIDKTIEKLTSEVIESQKIQCKSVEVATVTENLRKNDIMTCDVCPFVSCNPEQMDDHKLTHDEEKAESISSELLEKHKLGLENELKNVSDIKPAEVRRSLKVLFACQYCKCQYKSEFNLFRHIRRFHRDKNTFKCNKCDYRGSIRLLSVHKKVHLKQFCYDFHCNFSCISSYTMKRHIVNVHGEQPNFKCGICGMISVSQNTFRIHVMKHTGKKPLQCSYCDYRCRSKVELNTHVRKHTIGKTFISVPRRRHFAKKFKCRTCPFSCKCSRTMKMHQLKHVGESPFRCNFCDFSCRSAAGLKSHQETHTVSGEKAKEILNEQPNMAPAEKRKSPQKRNTVLER